MTRYSLGELAREVGATVIGDAERVVTGLRPLDVAGPEHVSFYHNRRYLEAARQSRAGALLVADAEPFPGRDLLVCADAYPAFAALASLFHPVPKPAPGVHPSAVVAASARVDEGASIGPQAVVGERVVVGRGAVVGACVVLGDDAEIGPESVLHPHVAIEPGCRVGARCIIHAGSVIGSDGFGFATVRGEHRKVPQVGIVVIEDEVEIGANVSIDRATLGETRIGRGTKTDNLVQIGHNVRVGDHSLLVAQVGISGSTHLGHHVILAGQSGVAGHLHIADGTVVAAQSAVMADTRAGETVMGSPARPQREWMRAMANLLQIETLKKRLRALEETVARLGGKA